jgi:GT2 family glycosyltransferase
MNTTIIIVTFKSEKVIYKCLSSINNNYPVIIIENSSNKNFKKQIENKFINVKCILAGENLGFGKANNIGLRKIKTKYVFLLNPDTKLKKNTLKFILYYAKKIENLQIVKDALNISKISCSSSLFKSVKLETYRIYFQFLSSVSLKE